MAEILERLLAEGFGYDEIALITCRSLDDSVFSAVNGVGSVSLRRFTGEYTSDGRQIMTDGQLLFDSIRRFKGQDAPAIILVDIDPDPSRLAHWYRLLYCGMTRATVKLDLLVRRDNPLTRELQL